MKALSTSVFSTVIDGLLYKVIVENYKSVSHVYFKKHHHAFWSLPIILRGKDRKRPINDVISEYLKNGGR